MPGASAAVGELLQRRGIAPAARRRSPISCGTGWEAAPCTAPAARRRTADRRRSPPVGTRRLPRCGLAPAAGSRGCNAHRRSPTRATAPGGSTASASFGWSSSCSAMPRLFQVGACAGARRADFAQVCLGFGPASLRGQPAAVIGVRIGEVGLQRDGAAEAGLGIGRRLAFGQRVGEVVPDLGDIRARSPAAWR